MPCCICIAMASTIGVRNIPSWARTSPQSARKVYRYWADLRPSGQYLMSEADPDARYSPLMKMLLERGLAARVTA